MIQPSIPNDQSHVPLQSVEPNQMWVAKIVLGNPKNWEHAIAEGMIYLFYGNQEIDGEIGRVHFGIKYRIEMVDGRISKNSEIWMGSLYNLNGRVLIPNEKNILLDRWFDFRPIPEIQGENTSDPMLLGIPEHVK
jgi:hypothetical protein